MIREPYFVRKADIDPKNYGNEVGQVLSTVSGEYEIREPSDLDAFIGIATGLGMGACLIAVLSIIWCLAN